MFISMKLSTVLFAPLNGSDPGKMRRAVTVASLWNCNGNSPEFKNKPTRAQLNRLVSSCSVGVVYSMFLRFITPMPPLVPVLIPPTPWLPGTAWMVAWKLRQQSTRAIASPPLKLIVMDRKEGTAIKPQLTTRSAQNPFALTELPDLSWGMYT